MDHPHLQYLWWVTNFIFFITGCFSSGEKKTQTMEQKDTFLNEADRGRTVIPIVRLFHTHQPFYPNISVHILHTVLYTIP